MADAAGAHAPEQTFTSVPIGEQFYQSSSYFPMPVVLVSTLAPDGQTNLAPYSLLFPRVEPGRHLLELVCGKGNKTAENLLRTGVAAISFIVDDTRLLEGCRQLARPAPTADKMRESLFDLVDSPAGPDRPQLVEQAVQVYECRLDRTVEHDVFEGRHRFVLEVEHIWMKPRWFDALRRSEGAPSLAIDYGFRQTASSWLVRSRSRMAKARLRPRYQMGLDAPPDALLERFRRALSTGISGRGITGAVSGRSVSLHIPKSERHFWSPHLELDLEDSGEGTLVYARVGPHPHVWTLFVAFHAAVAFTGLAGTIYGFAQWGLGQSAWGLLCLPAAICLHAFVGGAAFVGQGLGADQVYRLRAFVDEVLAA